ncbi:PREDICTED: receptor-like protein 12 [Nicotiana attenuata]|uniref:Lrr receptor-like serinethreonine-protein kinase gso1 n=1 Tax=Nicotiana attenuata TaxID=49451 RepID=A0A1J6IN44_NICAT|nr:PREDICTED: receptor-like protein 12 [Nicotiana attenuata]OIT06278.1 lrr receptor-like serinethreonine-protein kinase gso1 [Nicotiana attenuata]
MRRLYLVLVLFISLIITFKFSSCAGICKENEKRALLRLKKEANDPTNILSTWIDGEDCCNWEGILCHNVTGSVIELSINGWDYAEIKGLMIDNFHWLSSLENLNLLDMSGVDLSKATNWTEVINILPSLVNLRFSNCSLHSIPSIFDHNNSVLENLDLSLNNFSSSIPGWVFSFSNLVSLEFTGSNFIGSFPKGPFNLTFFTTLSASSNLFNSVLPQWLFDLNNLEYIDLSNCLLEGQIPSRVGHFCKLSYLNLAINNLNSTIPNWLYGCKNLETLNLRENKLEGKVSDFISNLTSLTSIDMSVNLLSGKLPSVIGKLGKLEDLDLSENRFEGEVSEIFNTMYDCPPIGSGNCSSLRNLRLNDNKLVGNLPKSFGQLSNLQFCFMENNKLEGVLTEDHFTNLTNLKFFQATKSNLTLSVSSDWIPPFQASDILIGGWRLGPKFPLWIQSQQSIMNLDISNVGIVGQVPTWFWNLSSQIRFLNISHNQLIGEIPTFSISSDSIGSGGPWLMYLNSNNFSGSLPHIPTMVTELDLSDNSLSEGLTNFLCDKRNESYMLTILHLGGNLLSEEIPDCWMNWPELEVLNLGENKLSGGIPRSIGALSKLKSLDLKRNRLSGSLPSSLNNCTNLWKIDLNENELDGNLPTWLGTKLSNLTVLSLRSNKFDGELPPELCQLSDLQILDLANNKLFGDIPMCVNNFTAMVNGRKIIRDADEEMDYSYYVGVFRESARVATKGNIYQYDTILSLFTSMDLSNNNLSGNIPMNLTTLVGLRSLNFSNNHLTGSIPKDIGNMKVLESLDLSNNQLSGEIPRSVSSLFSLSYLNVSHNNLSGRIPVGTQLQTFGSSSFSGNKLCGLPLSERCSDEGENPEIGNEEVDRSEDDNEVEWFYISMAIGFIVTFWGVTAPLLFIRSWRYAYYRFLDRKWKSWHA